MGRRRLFRKLFLASVFLLTGASLSLGLAQSKKTKKPKMPDLEISSVKFVRDGNNIEIDGSVRNTGDKSVAGLLLLFNFFSPNKESLTIQNGPVEAAVVEVGETVDFRFIVKAPPRATAVLVEAQDKNQRDLNVQNNGLFTIE
jgi:hypothetical protein